VNLHEAVSQDEFHIAGRRREIGFFVSVTHSISGKALLKLVVMTTTENYLALRRPAIWNSSGNCFVRFTG